MRSTNSLAGILTRVGILVCVLLYSVASAYAEDESIGAFWLPSSESDWTANAVPILILKRKDGAMRTVSRNLISNVLSVKHRIEDSSGVHAEFALIDSKQPNAFAFENNGRHIFAISISMLNYIGHDQNALASIIGHEYAHLYLKHSGINRKKREELAHVASAILGAILNINGVPLGGTIADLGVTAYARSFSRDEEREADDYGVKWAVEAGFDPCGRYTTMKLLQMISNESFMTPFLSTHPSATERSQTANEYALKIKGVGCE